MVLFFCDLLLPLFGRFFALGKHFTSRLLGGRRSDGGVSITTPLPACTSLPAATPLHAAAPLPAAAPLLTAAASSTAGSGIAVHVAPAPLLSADIAALY